MPVLYDNFPLRPVQSVDFTTEKQSLGDGRLINSVVRATVRGTIVPGNPDGVMTPLPQNEKMSAVLVRQKEMRAALAVDGRVFEVQGWDGSAPAKFQAHVVSLDFEEGPWYDKCDYVLVLQSSGFSGEADGSFLVESASESWSVSSEERPNKVSHTASAKGQLVFDATGAVPKLPWEYAKDFVTNQLGLGWTAVGSAFSPKSGQTIAAGLAGQPLSTSVWNRVVQEEVNEAEGTYSATESWVLWDDPYYEDSQVAARKVDDQPNTTVVVSLSGTVSGHSEAVNDVATRLANARTGWASIKSQLQARAVASAGTALNPHPSGYSVEEHPQTGSLSYQVEFNNRTLTNDTTEVYTVAKKRAATDYYTTVSVDGTVTGVLYMDTDTDPAVRFTRAQLQWARVLPLLYARAVSASGLTSLQPRPVDAQVSEDPAAGTVSYAFQYDTRPVATARFEYTVSRKYSRDEARTSVTVEGTVTGLGAAGSDPFAPSDPNERIDNAKSYWTGVEPGLLSLAALYVDTADQWMDAWSQSYSLNPTAGTVSFSYEFTSQVRCFPNALSEVLSVTTEAAVPVVAGIEVPGRRAGPIGQDMGTLTAARTTFNAELILPLPKKCGYYPPPAVDPTPYRPQGGTAYVAQDTANWAWTTGRYSRTVTWVVYN